MGFFPASARTQTPFVASDADTRWGIFWINSDWHKYFHAELGWQGWVTRMRSLVILLWHTESKNNLMPSISISLLYPINGELVQNSTATIIDLWLSLIFVDRHQFAKCFVYLIFLIHWSILNDLYKFYAEHFTEFFESWLDYCVKMLSKFAGRVPGMAVVDWLTKSAQHSVSHC